MLFRSQDGPGLRPSTPDYVQLPPAQPKMYETDKLGRMSEVIPPRPMAPPARGYGQHPPMPHQLPYQQIPPQVIVQQKRGVNHGLHLILTLLTFGLWLPIWILDAMFNS